MLYTCIYNIYVYVPNLYKFKYVILNVDVFNYEFISHDFPYFRFIHVSYIMYKSYAYE